ncbi:hypothetical protein Hypma_008811 [Hypsizygus marmoreus]|uniref:NYN domain-containing protein n=1 Tax=Hypsizygus marmoreus TaxID=39966 RepID=A0A369JZA8_HYPMA|nr:hypothetical protein Hypma_008811 [Hypsizygus marmoreus]
MATDERGRPVAIFWDFDACPLSVRLSASETVEGICRAANLHGSVTVFQLFLERRFDGPAILPRDVRSQLEHSGVAVVECFRESASNHAIQLPTDMLLFAVDNSPPATIVLISDNTDYTYAISQLKRRKYKIVLIVPSRTNMPRDLGIHADLVLDFDMNIVEEYLSNKAYRQALGQGVKEPRSISTNKKDYAGKYSPRLGTPKQLASSSRSSINSSENQGLSYTARSPTAATSWRRNMNPSVVPPPARPGLVVDPSPGLNETTFNPRKSVVSASQLADKPDHSNPSRFRKGTYRPPVPARIDQAPTESFDKNTTMSANDMRRDSLTSWSSAVFPEEITQSSPVSPSSGRSELRDIPSRAAPQGNLGLSFDLYQADDGGEPSGEPSSSSVVYSSESGSASRVYVGLSNELTHAGRLGLSLPTQGFSPYQEDQANSHFFGDSSHVRTETEQFTIQTFSPLIEELSRLRADGNSQPLRSLVGTRLRRDAYVSAGVADFGEYVAMAESSGLVELGGAKGTAWIALRSR